eukprot:gene29362-12453_t
MNSPGQGLSATMIRSSTMDTCKGPRTMKPVVAVVTYNDISPVTTSEYVRGDDEGLDAATANIISLAQEGSTQRPASAHAGGAGKDTRTAMEL